MQNELSPCPFCGGAGAMLELQSPEDPSTYAVQCTCCRALGAEEATPLQAARVWNQRFVPEVEA